MQQLREHYERQDTEELLEIAKKDLLEEARATLLQVLAARGVPESAVNAAQQEGVQLESKRQQEQKRLASRTLRLVAFAIDVWGVLLVLLLLLLPIKSISDAAYGNSVTFVWLAYFLFRDGIPGQSVGKRLLGIKAVNMETHMACTWGTSFVRNIPHLFFFIDAIFALGEKRMRLGDRFAGTTVIRRTAAPLSPSA